MVMLASKFTSDIALEISGNRLNPKRFDNYRNWGCAPRDDTFPITIFAHGPDEADAIDAFSVYFSAAKWLDSEYLLELTKDFLTANQDFHSRPEGFVRFLKSWTRSDDRVSRQHENNTEYANAPNRPSDRGFA